MTRTLITILTWNRLDITKSVFQTLINHNKDNMRDVLFMDNGSTDGTVKWIEKSGFEVLKNKENEGIFMGTRRVWLEGVKRGYDFIINLQNDFPCLHSIPFDDIEAYLDAYSNVGFVRLNEKKKKPGRNINKLTKEKLKYKTYKKFGNTEFAKHNHHFSFNPNFIKSSIIDHLVNPVEKPRERQIMERFNSLKMYAAKIKDPCPIFKTVIRDREEGWEH